MDLNGRGKGVHVPGTWLPATPSKPTPTRPPHGNPAATAMPNLYESLGMGGFPPDFFQGTASTSNGGVNKTTCVNQGVEMNSWEAALAGKDKTPYEETMNSLNSWNNVSFQELLAFVNRNSTTASVKQREVKKAATRPYFPFALPENSNNQLQTNSANMFMEQNYSIALNQRNGGNQPRQMPQYVFPVPYSSAHDLGSSSSRMMYDLNSAPATISDAVSNGSISFQCAPSTPDKGHRMQQNQLSESSQYATVMWSSTMQQQQHHNQSFESAISNDNASLHFANSTSDDMRSKRQHNQLASLQFAHTASDDILSTVQNNQLLEAVTNGQIAPLTPDKANQTSELINNVQDERTAREKGEDELPKGSSNFELHSSQESCSALENPVVPTENHRPEKGDENGIDLNKTPQQKPRRKKHRPKVVVEGKPKRTPKSAVKQNSMKEKQEKRKQNGMKETERVKRKYVRRKSTKTSDTPSDDYVVEGTNDANQSNDVGARSCKRSLNFDLEGQGHESQCTTQIHTETPPSIHKISRAYDQCTNNEDSSGTTTLLFSHGLERNSLAGIALDMNRDVGQQIVDYIELPDINPHPTRREVLRQNLKVLARDGEYQSNANHVLKNHKDSSMLYGISQVSKRAHLQTVDEGQFSLKAFQEGMLFPEIYKKRRTTTSTNSKLSTSQWNTSQHSSTTSQHLNGNCIESLRNGSSTSVYCSPSVPGEHLSQMQNTPEGAHPDRLNSSYPDRLNSSSELMLTIRKTEMKTGKRSKVHTRVRDFATLTTVTQCNNLQSPVPRNAPASHAPASHDRGVLQVYQRTLPTLSVNKYSRKRSSRSTVTFPNITEMRQQKDHAAISAYGHYPAKPRGTSLGVKGVQEVVQKSNSSIDDLVRGLECLSVSGKTNMVSRKEQSALVPFSINGDSNMVSGNQQTTLVPFKGDDRMVPYRGIFDPTKKRKPRAKVDINQETDNMYKLVMYNIPYRVEDAYWKSERGIMLGRANSFIARMHLIQGDRGFTPWRGSVLDSVIGVFLTQNVSDHLSSSAFMSLVATFPLKPTSNDKTCHEGELKMYVEEPDVPILDSVNIKWRESMPPPEPSRSQDTESSITVHETNDTQDKEVGNITESFGSNTGGGCSSGISDKEVGTCGEPLKTNADILTERCAGFVGEDGRILEVESSGVSPQTSAGITSCSDSNSEEEDLTRLKPNENSSSFMQLLHTTRCFQHFYNLENESLSIDLNTIQSYNQPEPGTSEKILNLDRRYAEDRFKFQHIETPTIPSSNCCLQSSTEIGVQDMHCPELIGVQILSSPPLTNGNEEKKYDKDMSLNAQAASVCNPDSYLDRQSGQPSISLEQEACLDKQPNPWKYIQPEISRTCELEGIQSAESEILNPLAQRRETRIQQASSDSPDFSGETLDVVESTTLIEKKSSTETTDAESIRKEKAYSSILSHERSTKTLKPVAKLAKEKSKTFDWDSLRKEAYQKCGKREQNDDTLDSLDWEAVRCADVNEIAKAIKERGMNNMLAERIKDFLNRLVREHGSLNLEWLRDVPPEKAKEYLLSVRGLGLKSVECVRLLTLHHVAFPVDTNVGRIAVRLGWVPLQPLPESLQLHLLEMYPVLESIQKYLWPRLFKLDQRTLYELHYQMITFGKVFCTKSKPNCNACPMRADCRHFASAFAREKLLLPGPEEKGIVSSTVPSMANQTPAVGITTMSLPPPEANKLSETIATINNREPIIEVPASPEPECNDITESDIEDAFFEDPDEIPVIKLNIECFAQNLQNYMQENNMELQDAGLSKTLVTLNPEAASIPTPKLKNVNRLRTEHQVYELPDSHPLLKGVERRFPGDVSSYLLAIWTPGETAESIEPPERCCSSQMSGSLCNEETCFSCNSTREANSQTVRGTLLIPCKTAMRGSFPLNGTYFQVNEVFADHESSLNPIDVPRAWLWNLPKRTVYFGTSIPSIFKGQTTEQIQSCFWKGYVCVRGFDRKTRAPRPLIARLHFPASRLAVRTKAKKDE